MEVKRQMAVTPMWTRSPFCADNACVEVAPLGGDLVGMRDAKNPDQPHLSFARLDWYAFLDKVAAGGYRSL